MGFRCSYQKKVKRNKILNLILRFEKRIMIPLPDVPARYAMIKNMLKTTPNTLNDKDMSLLAEKTDG